MIALKTVLVKLIKLWYYAFMTESKKAKKQVIVDPDLYTKLKGTLTMKGASVSEWFEEKAREEVYGKLSE